METQTIRVSGYFDVREYCANKPRESWRIKASDANISFTAIFADVPAQLAEFAKQYTNRDGETRYRVSFKIGRSAVWANEQGQGIPRPENESLDKGKYECVIIYATLRGQGEKAPKGYWVNGIQIRPVNTVMFAPMDSPETVAAIQSVDEKEPDPVADQLAGSDIPDQSNKLPF